MHEPALLWVEAQQRRMIVAGSIPTYLFSSVCRLRVMGMVYVRYMRACK